jgi:hypothetical protein
MNPILPRIDLIGVGGIGAALVPTLLRMSSKLVLWDPDVYEESNVLRQAHPDWVGRNKSGVHREKHAPVAEALPHRPSILSADQRFFYHEGRDHNLFRILVCTADTAAARIAAREACDTANPPNLVFFAANEEYSGEAYVFSPELPGFPDPLQYFPHAFADGAADETRPHCHTMADIEVGGQTASTNHKIGGDLIFLMEAWLRHITPELILAGLEIPYLVTSSKIRKEVRTWRRT